MIAFPIFARIVGVSQIALGLLYLFLPHLFLRWQGLQTPPPDTAYPLAMLAARFLVYGVGMFRIAVRPEHHLFWARGMILIQLIDLAAGAVLVMTGVVPVGAAAIPMINATLFAAGLYFTLERALRLVPA